MLSAVGETEISGTLITGSFRHKTSPEIYAKCHFSFQKKKKNADGEGTPTESRLPQSGGGSQDPENLISKRFLSGFWI